jgi:hypothetical protein
MWDLQLMRARIDTQVDIWVSDAHTLRGHVGTNTQKGVAQRPATALHDNPAHTPMLALGMLNRRKVIGRLLQWQGSIIKSSGSMKHIRAHRTCHVENNSHLLSRKFPPSAALSAPACRPWVCCCMCCALAGCRLLVTASCRSSTADMTCHALDMTGHSR